MIVNSFLDIYFYNLHITPSTSINSSAAEVLALQKKQTAVAEKLATKPSEIVYSVFFTIISDEIHVS